MRKILLVYIVLSIAVISVKLLQLDSIENFLKPLLMPVLAVFYFQNRTQIRNFDIKILFALFFSTIGDVLLMPFFNHFILGLLGFLIAHIFYIAAFLSERRKKIGEIPLQHFIILAIGLILAVLLVVLIIPALSSTILKTAICLYALTLLILLISSALRHPSNQSSSNLTIWGAFIFMFSDGMIAINKFLFLLPLSSLAIMGTYTLAQYLIISGSIRRDN